MLHLHAQVLLVVVLHQIIIQEVTLLVHRLLNYDLLRFHVESV